MAKLRKGILGPISGKLGPIVGATWKNIPYVREKPGKPKGKRKRSETQISNQHRFKYIQQWLVPFYPYLEVGFMNLAVDKTEINVAYSINYQNAFSGVWPDIIVDYSKVVISAGQLSGLVEPAIQLSSPTSVILSWEKNTGRYHAYDDQLMLVLYCPELKVANGFIGGVRRNALQCSFTFSAELTGKVLEAYVSVTSSNRKKTSNSIYLGRIQP